MDVREDVMCHETVVRSRACCVRLGVRVPVCVCFYALPLMLSQLHRRQCFSGRRIPWLDQSCRGSSFDSCCSATHLLGVSHAAAAHFGQKSGRDAHSNQRKAHQSATHCLIVANQRCQAIVPRYWLSVPSSGPLAHTRYTLQPYKLEEYIL